MSGPTIALLHPGDMGAAIGACLRARGLAVRWASAGRSPDTRQRAEAAGLADAGSLEGCLAGADAVLSVCPPHAAARLAEAVAACGFRGLYIDANAIAPQASEAVGRIMTRAGARYVDGGIVGPPPVSAGRTRLFLSGPQAGEAAVLLGCERLETVVLDARIGSASALKMCYAAWTKGSIALLAAIRALAAQEGVDAALLAEWGRSQPGLEKRSEGIVQHAHKAWRWIGEMEQIAAGFRAHGLPGGFHDAAAELYAHLQGFKGRGEAPTIDAVLRMLQEARAAQ
jgi:3-hydroxyisobutyrate dehydrogenase-like beta-hydroxyacid dehydrogenase